MQTQPEPHRLLHSRGTQFSFLFAPPPPPPPRHVRPHTRSRQRTHAPTAGNISAQCISGAAWRKTLVDNNIASVGQLGEKLRAILARGKQLVIALRYCQHPSKRKKKTQGDSRAFEKSVPSPCATANYHRPSSLIEP
jgi:hypothetical protein